MENNPKDGSQSKDRHHAQYPGPLTRSHQWALVTSTASFRTTTRAEQSVMDLKGATAVPEADHQISKTVQQTD